VTVTAEPARTAPAAPVASVPMSRREILEALSGLMLVLFVAMISSTIVTTALPRILGALNGSQNQFTWVVTAALLTATASTPIWGKLADLYSKKTVVQAAIVVFLIGSLLSGLAQNAGQLIVARGFQGIGIGGLQALVQVVLAAIIPPRERGRYNGYVGAVMAVATVAGPLLGGLIVDTSWLGWRWCFFIGIPIALAALGVLHKTLHVVTARLGPVTVDYLGATLIATGVGILLVWVSFVDNSFVWISWPSAAMVGAGVSILAVALFVEARAAEPVVPLRIVARRETALAIFASLTVGVGIFGAAVFLAQYFQIGRGYSPTRAGLLTIPLMAGLLISSTISGRLVSRSGRLKPYVVTGLATVLVGNIVLAFLDHATPLWLIGAGAFLIGAGVGMSMQNLILSVQNSVALRDLGAASSTVTFFRALGGTVGVSVLGAVLVHGVDNAAPTGGDTLNLGTVPEPALSLIRTAYGDATGHVFLISAAVAATGLVAALLMKPSVLRSSIDLPDPR
jgi:EmrB/QacA subfamily drug resistance transporter